MLFRTLHFVLLLVTGTVLHAQQAPPVEWEYTWGGSDGDVANALDRADDGAIFLGGQTYSHDGDVNGSPDVYGDAWLVKMVDGTIVWQRVFGGTEADIINATAATPDGGCVVAGGSRSNNAEFTGNHGTDDVWIAKLDENGATEWSRMLGGTDFEIAHDIDLCADGGYVVAGYAGSTDGDVLGNHGSSDGWVVRLDAAGNIVWSVAVGGSGGDVLNSVRETADGGFVLAGGTLSNDGQVTGNHGGGDAWLAYLDADGNLVWSRSLGGSQEDNLAAVRECADGGFICTGYSASSDGDVSTNHGYRDVCVVRVNHRGHLLWQRSLGGSYDDRAEDIEQMTDGRFVLAGTISSFDGDCADNHSATERDMWAVKMDTAGQVLWHRALGGSQGEGGNAVRSHPDGGVLLAGFAMSNDGDVSQCSAYTDMWVLKLGADVVGMYERDRSGISITNDGGGGITLQSEEPLTNARITWWDALGRTVQRSTFNGRSGVLRTDHLNIGSYTVTVETGGRMIARRVVLAR